MPDNPSNSRIKKLSPLLINQLAAGEVVTRPAAVVKELLENAIDAGASNIEIRITQGGMGMIEVLDNGTGIHPDDMVMAITRHATSKVADVANLHGITTLGFRGEALAATAAVSRLTLTSSHDDSGIGRQLQVAGVLDEVPKLLPVVHQRGTTITVKDLYFNVPARRGNLKSIATEFGHIETIVREVALARADVALTLFHDNKKRLSLSSRAMSANDNDNTNSSNNNAHRLPLSRLEQATGLTLTDNALEISIDLTSLMQLPKDYVNNNFAGQVSINGWLWLSNDSQSTFPKLIYVNGRLVKEALISNQLRQLAQSAQLSGIGYALYFDLPTDWLNINVHPSKQRIKISPLNNIMAHLSHAIQAKLKTVATKQNINQTINSAAESSQVLDNHLSINNAFATVRQQTSSAIYSAKSQQVQAPKQPYQLSENTDNAQSSEQATFTENINPGSTLISTANTSQNLSIKNAPLPYCLEVILNTSHNLDAIKNVSDKTLPWLLFYSCSQFFLIGAEIWQAQLSLLFESDIFREQVSFNDANAVNQQLTDLATKMPTEDLWAFNADIEDLLAKHAFKSINNQLLIALMLSSTAI
ncbi:DNA mismatch repair endonuclease MutL [Psychrobacter sp. van23A]|uniref:DNA mismatch repair endonuclease MutL n=1 Tax=Psychrobacter sp. van23A TaxID=3064892 RepID=UPI0027B9A50A|nr:DNA mismatch repair endonuclease MutL [Psychrobacter sp. van23A]WLW67398.1 DNA mismatch repair endonuclease MutL [Psychrobacter sp. van23A]